jgi:biotin operon repressor
MPYTHDGVGYQRTDTSRDAADGIAPRARAIRKAVLDYLTIAPRPRSTEEIAAAVGVIYASVQPRLSELRNDGLVIDSGARGTSRYGKKCILWQIAPKP